MGQVGYAGNETPLGKTSSADFRRFLAALWVNTDTNPVLYGGEVSGRPDRAYAYSAGVGAIKVGDGSVVLTWAAGQTSLVAQPTTPRTDVVYVGADGAVRVGTEGVVNESNVVVLRRMAAPAGMTATTQATRKGGRNFALPYGASLGWLGSWLHIYQGQVSQSQTWSTLTSIPFSVPTDRIVDIEVHQSIFGEIDYGWPETDARKLGVGAMHYRAFVDNVHIRSFEIQFTRYRAVSNHTIHFHQVAEGNHILRVERRWTGVGAYPWYFGGGADLEEGNFIGIKDQGVAP